MSYTKGPWKVRYKLNVESESSRHIASCGINMSGNQGKVIEECEANARLIAAAPELLEACKKALDFLNATNNNWSVDLMNSLENSIAKAEGK